MASEGDWLSCCTQGNWTLAQTSIQSYRSSVFALCQCGKSESGHGQCLPEFPTVLGNKGSVTTEKLVGLANLWSLVLFYLMRVWLNVHMKAGDHLVMVAQAPYLFVCWFR